MKTVRKRPDLKPFTPNPNIWRRHHQGESPNQPTNSCQIKEKCGSCAYINGAYNESLATKVQVGAKLLEDAGLLRTGMMLPAVGSPITLGYRTHAKLAVRPARPTNADPSRFAIGLYRPGSHEVVPLENCPVHRHVINDLLFALKAELEVSTLQPYDERANTGDLKYLGIRVSHLTSEILLTFVLTHEQKTEVRRIVNSLRQKGHHIVSSHMNINPGNGNAIFSAENILAAGSDRLRERLCDVQFELGPTSFMQVNPWQAELVYRRIESLAGNAARPAVAWDLYCGIGPITLMLSRAGYRVLGIEENPAAIEDAKHNSKRNREIPEPTYLVGTVEEQCIRGPEWARNPNLIVANPSRRGIADSARKLIRQTLIENRGSKFIYLSCEVETLARDLKDIVSDSSLTIRQIEPFDMFPFTEKVEWLTVVTN